MSKLVEPGSFYILLRSSSIQDYQHLKAIPQNEVDVNIDADLSKMMVVKTYWLLAF